MDAPTLYEHIQKDERVPAKYRRLAKPIDEATTDDVFRLQRAGLDPTDEAKAALYDPVENPKDEATIYLASGETRTFESVEAARDAFERGDISRGTYDKVMSRFRGLDGGPASEAVGDSTETSEGSTGSNTLTYEASSIQRAMWDLDNLSESQRRGLLVAAIEDEHGGKIGYKAWYDETGEGKFYRVDGREYGSADVKHLGNGRFEITLSGTVSQHDPRSEMEYNLDGEMVDPDESTSQTTTDTTDTTGSTDGTSGQPDDWEPKSAEEIMEERGLSHDDLQDVGPDTDSRTNEEIIEDRSGNESDESSGGSESGSPSIDKKTAAGVLFAAGAAAMLLGGR
jgi:hypothetical protein